MCPAAQAASVMVQFDCEPSKPVSPSDFNFLILAHSPKRSSSGWRGGAFGRKRKRTHRQAILAKPFCLDIRRQLDAFGRRYIFRVLAKCPGPPTTHRQFVAACIISRSSGRQSPPDILTLAWGHRREAKQHCHSEDPSVLECMGHAPVYSEYGEKLTLRKYRRPFQLR